MIIKLQKYFHLLLKTRYLFILFFLINSTLSYSQTNTASLLKQIGETKQDSTIIELYLDLGYKYEHINSDSALYCYDKAIEYSKKSTNQIQEAKALMYKGIVYGTNGSYEKSLEFFNKSLSVNSLLSESKKKSNIKAGKLGISKCYGNIGTVYRDQGDYDKALENFSNQLKSSTDIDNKKQISNAYRSLGTVYSYQGNYEDAMASFHKSLKIDNALDNPKGVAMNYGNIGNVLSEQKNYSQALEYYYKQLEISEKINAVAEILNCYGSIGTIHSEQGEYVKAINSYEKSLEICKKIGDKTGTARNYENIGIAYNKLGNTNKAKEYSEKSLKIKEYLGDKNGMATSLSNIMSQNIKLAKQTNNSSLKRNYLNEAVKYGERAMEISNEIDALPNINSASNNLKIAYTSLGSYKKALDYANIYIWSSDSMFSEQKTKALTEMTTRYESEKKQLQIEKMAQQKELDNTLIEAQQAKNRKQLYVIISALVGLTIVLAFSIIMLRMFRQKKQANILLSEQKLEISEKNEELNQQAEELQFLNENLHQQNEEITTQRDEIESQKDIIEEIYHHVEESINYATRLQKSILPDNKVLTKYFSDHFVLFKPKDKVSGDFYWWTHIENHTVITAADSTGHGVPGAFMSMLGVSFLREIVQKEYITHPGVILRKLRKEIIKALKQKGETGEQKDGMDMALISVNHETNILQFAGANNPLYIISENQIEGLQVIENMTKESSKFFYEIKPDKMPIAIYEKMDKFQTHEIQLQKGDQVFMFSDGFADQFGGPKDKKFKYKPFKKLLLENSKKTLEEQKYTINAAFEDWRNNTEQVDDVVIVSIKV